MKKTFDKIRKATLHDVLEIKALHEDVLKEDIHNLIPYIEELTNDFISNELNECHKRGFAFVVEKDNKIIGYVKAFTGTFAKESHILKNARIIFSKEVQKTVIPYRTLKYIEDYIYSEMPHIMLFQVEVHSHNISSIRLHEKIGFKKIVEIQNGLKLKNEKFINQTILLKQSIRINN